MPLRDTAVTWLVICRTANQSTKGTHVTSALSHVTATFWTQTPGHVLSLFWHRATLFTVRIKVHSTITASRSWSGTDTTG